MRADDPPLARAPDPSFRHSSMHARLFLAIWPSEQVHAALLRAQHACDWPPTARLTRSERLHLTLHFIGNVEAGRIEELGTALAVRVEAVDMEFDAFEVWRGGIAALVATRPSEGLLRLHEALADALSEAELPIEKRPYRPHVTMARHARGARAPARLEPVRWRAEDGYALVRTLPGGGYESLARFA